ncbi:MAG: ComEA family DNA-binding protein [Dehalococcoidia bacterium]|nr:ComEA family DNA-binding protein [Dehalococcoidia bacterium]
MRQDSIDNKPRTPSGFRRYWYLVFVFLIVAIAFGGVVLVSKYGGGKQTEEIVVATSTPSQSREMEIHIGGAVVSPGIYTVDESCPLEDVIRMAGGCLTGADCSGVDIYISPLDGSSLRESQKVNLNTAEDWLLCALPGIGSGRAAAIIEYREQNGPFKDVEELLDVPGVGIVILDKIRNLVTVS